MTKNAFPGRNQFLSEIVTRNDPAGAIDDKAIVDLIAEVLTL